MLPSLSHLATIKSCASKTCLLCSFFLASASKSITYMRHPMASKPTSGVSRTLRRPIAFAVARSASGEYGPRLGAFSAHGRNKIETPACLALSSRGAVPHMSQDLMQSDTKIKGIYTALEDFLERAGNRVPPVLQTPALSHESPLRRFIGLQQDALLVLGPRRVPALPCPTANTFYAMSIVTSLGFDTLESADYIEAVQKLRPDIVLGMSDVVAYKPGIKRIQKMGDRTESWLKGLVEGALDQEDGTPGSAIFAPILPIEEEQQAYYLQALQEEYYHSISGLVLHDTSSITSIPANLRHLPRACTADLGSPHRLLEAISYGIDLFMIPFVGRATDAGIALDFSFPAQDLPGASKPLPLGIDMWSISHATDTGPLREGCCCYTCNHHHRAYVQHLLSAKEMLGWVLLQLHNHHIMDVFFEGVRQAIQSNRFEEAHRGFCGAYEADLPAGSGQGPRVRGYQIKSEGKGEARKNPPAYRSLDDAQEKLAEARLPSPELDAHDMEQLGFGEIAE